MFSWCKDRVFFLDVDGMVEDGEGKGENGWDEMGLRGMRGCFLW